MCEIIWKDQKIYMIQTSKLLPNIEQFMFYSSSGE